MTQKGHKQLYWSEEEIQVVKDFYGSKPKDFILQKLPNRTWKSVIHKGNQLGLSRLLLERAIIDMSIIDTEEKAYILGLWAADGNVNKRMLTAEIRLSGEDGEFLYSLAKIIGECSIKHRDNRRGFGKENAKPQIELRVHSKRFCQDLGLWGVKPRKSFSLAPPKGLSNDMVKHYIRGYIDGDGAISFSNSGYVEVIIHSADASFLEFIRSWFNNLHPNRTKITPSHHTWCLHYGSKSALNILKHTYGTASVGLPRKMVLAHRAFSECSDTGAFK